MLGIRRFTMEKERLMLFNCELFFYNGLGVTLFLIKNLNIFRLVNYEKIVLNGLLK